jgi:MoaA/NifB/PqqE/SkfB family radical SAM enzyme
MTHFCRRPFTQLNIENTGIITPCCLIEPSSAGASFDQTDVEKYFVSDALRDLQQAFLNDEKPIACAVCWKNEDSGLKSLRIPEASTLHDLRRPDWNFEEIHLKMSSVCNFKCRMCHSYSSSAWLAEEKKFGATLRHFADGATTEIKHLFKNEKLRRDLFERVIPNTDTIRISGGEPLICSDTLAFLKELVVRGLNDKPILIFTNLSTLSFSGVYYPEFWKQFKNLKLIVSCDGAGKSVEYSRTGMDWENFKSNFIAVKDRISHVNCVIHIFSIQSIPDLVRFCWRHKVWVHLESVFNPDLNAQILSAEEKSRIKKIYDTFSERLRAFEFSIEHVDYVCNSVMDYLFKADLSETQEPVNFKLRNAELDKRRNSSFLETFPELASWYDAIPINRVAADGELAAWKRN